MVAMRRRLSRTSGHDLRISTYYRGKGLIIEQIVTPTTQACLDSFFRGTGFLSFTRARQCLGTKACRVANSLRGTRVRHIGRAGDGPAAWI